MEKLEKSTVIEEVKPSLHQHTVINEAVSPDPVVDLS